MQLRWVLPRLRYDQLMKLGWLGLFPIPWSMLSSPRVLVFFAGEPPQRTIYFDPRGWSWNDWEVDFVLATASEPESYVGAVREELNRLDPAIPHAHPRPMTAYLDDHLAQNRFALTLIGLFATVAGVLAVVGLYGVVSSLVSESRREIGIRMALGCNRKLILKWVYGQGAVLVGLGIGIGVAAALGLGRFIASLLVGVAPTDAPTFALMERPSLSWRARPAISPPGERPGSIR